jgi:hypothetical protein
MNPRDQIPAPGKHVLDHTGVFAPDMEAGSTAMERLGFFMTPYTPQQHSLGPGQSFVPAGTGNRLAMFLVPHADGPIADQLRSAMKRYVGLHLIALGTADAASDHVRLERDGFPTIPMVNLQRPVDTPDGEKTARFSVARVPPGTMAEGRIQFCQHHTPEVPWQQRWMTHRNGATALTDILICVVDVVEAADRYSRFIGVPAVLGAPGCWLIATERGRIVLMDYETMGHVLPGLSPPDLPFMAAFAVACDDLAKVREIVATQRLNLIRDDGNVIITAPLPEMGTAVAFLADAKKAPWLP